MRAKAADTIARVWKRFLFVLLMFLGFKYCRGVKMKSESKVLSPPGPGVRITFCCRLDRLMLQDMSPGTVELMLCSPSSYDVFIDLAPVFEGFRVRPACH
jgi:hypothetical protein